MLQSTTLEDGDKKYDPIDEVINPLISVLHDALVSLPNTHYVISSRSVICER